MDKYLEGILIWDFIMDKMDSLVEKANHLSFNWLKKHNIYAIIELKNYIIIVIVGLYLDKTI